MADECKDISKHELVVVCVRLVETGDISTDGISAKILQVIEPFRLSVAFGFDGASVISGNEWCDLIVNHTFPNALYVHCNYHRLNLVLCTATKVSGHVTL